MGVNAKMTAIAEAIRAKTGKTAALTLDQMVTEIEGISGGTEIFAAIGVKYTPGKICQCYKDSKVLQAKNTSGQWVFAIPEEGEWTVDVEGKTQKINIETEGQFVTVNLATFYLFKEGEGLQNGQTYKKVSGSITSDSNSIVCTRVDSSTPGRAYFTPAIPIAEFSALTIEYTLTTKGSADYFGIIAEGDQLPTSSSRGNYTDTTTLSTDANVRAIKSLPFSEKTKKYHVAWSQSNNFTIHNLYME